MSFLKNTFVVKRVAILVSVVIVSLILWNTYVFFQNFKKEERLKMEIFAAAIKEFVTNQDLNDTFFIEGLIIENNTNIPSILVDENGEISSWHNLDSIKSQNPDYLKSQLAEMKSQNQPIVVQLNEAKKQSIYYKDSDLLNKLTYYPLALVLILILFLTVIYLFYSSNKAEETNKLWTGMAKETAHQIGTPLSSLLGWIAILKMEEIDDKYVEEIEKDVYRLNIIADRFSKIGSIPELKKQDIVTEAKQVFDYLSSRTSKQIEFNFTTSNAEITANINKELFGWVIENLVKNAIDAMKGKGTLYLDLLQESKKIKITVSDTGKGIPKSKFKQIFKPGFTTKTRGWGLGLSLSKRIVEDYHNGKIFVKKSEIGRGTSIQILLDKV
mgnify:CR=1 FL=1